MSKEIIKTDKGNQYTFYRTNNDVNGNPRYIVHFIDLGLELYECHRTPKTLGTGLSKYRGKDFGGGYVFQSYNLKHSAEYFESLGLYLQQ